MNKAYRKRTEIGVAFSSGLNCLLSKEIAINHEQQNPLSLGGYHDPETFFYRTKLKKMLRPMIRSIYRSLKQIIRPITFRVHHYFTAELNQRCMHLQSMTIILQQSLETMKQEMQQISTFINVQNKQILASQCIKKRNESSSLNRKTQAEIESFRAILINNPNVALIVEFDQSHLKRTNHSTKQWLKAFEDLNLCYKVINEKTKALEDCSVWQLENRESANLFFARKNSTAWEKTAV
ncbi:MULTISPECIES: hypothetical protein [Legionella]|uniref:Uncharacterized protein n=1 Tax=Legionella drozanskii LLAP-1 TaxID=1212489 RepID=A0A0W0SMU6_9GAMM|nr:MULTISPECIES: hypothetical protein [Legionella]KTC84730.1 hypothetical protein Ldro_2894 [Legionella drozanskii LLAP-1]PJE18476.1 MAG: hypothetical protein CK430_00005 [Legionella sp.]